MNLFIRLKRTIKWNYTLIPPSSPKKGGFSNFLHDYQEAQHVGQSLLNTTCVDFFPRCPISVFELFQSYGVGGSTGSSEQPMEQEIEKVTITPKPFAESETQHHSYLTRDHFISKSSADARHASTIDANENSIV